MGQTQTLDTLQTEIHLMIKCRKICLTMECKSKRFWLKYPSKNAWNDRKIFRQIKMVDNNWIIPWYCDRHLHVWLRSIKRRGRLTIFLKVANETFLENYIKFFANLFFIQVRVEKKDSGRSSQLLRKISNGRKGGVAGGWHPAIASFRRGRPVGQEVEGVSE